MHTAAIILAAGHSSRMGQFKPLLPLGEGTVLSQAVSTFDDVEQIIVVSGNRAEEVRPQAQALGTTVAHNPDYAKGMFSSVQAGVRALPDETDAFFVLPVDIPLVRPASVALLMQDYQRFGADVTFPCFRAERGHPPLIHARLIPAILDHDGQGGLRTVLEGPNVSASDVELADSNIIFDLDTPEHYQQALQRAKRMDLPTQEEIEALWDIAGTPANTRAHCRAVGTAATALAQALNQAQPALNLDIELVLTAALLHDVAKGQRRHEDQGGRLARRYGFPALEDPIASHRDLTLPPGAALSEREVVFLADKFVCGETVVLLRERYGEKIRLWAREPKVRQAIEGRLARAELILARYEFLTGTSAHQLVLEALS